MKEAFHAVSEVCPDVIAEITLLEKLAVELGKKEGFSFFTGSCVDSPSEGWWDKSLKIHDFSR